MVVEEEEEEEEKERRGGRHFVTRYEPTRFTASTKWPPPSQQQRNTLQTHSERVKRGGQQAQNRTETRAIICILPRQSRVSLPHLANGANEHGLVSVYLDGYVSVSGLRRHNTIK